MDYFLTVRNSMIIFFNSSEIYQRGSTFWSAKKPFPKAVKATIPPSSETRVLEMLFYPICSCELVMSYIMQLLIDFAQSWLKLMLILRSTLGILPRSIYQIIRSGPNIPVADQLEGVDFLGFGLFYHCRNWS